MEPATLIARLKAAGIKHELIAEALGRSRPVAVQVMNGHRPLKAHEMAPLERLLAEHDTAELEDSNSYVPVEVLPTFAGMGGGGEAGDFDRETALLPRALVEGVLRGNARDFVLINAEGDSMVPKFFQGDQILADRRKRDPAWAGPFLVRNEGSYVVKNVMKTSDGLRIFSQNPSYEDEYFDPDTTEIVGRPVWVGRMVTA